MRFLGLTGETKPIADIADVLSIGIVPPKEEEYIPEICQIFGCLVLKVLNILVFENDIFTLCKNLFYVE